MVIDHRKHNLIIKTDEYFIAFLDDKYIHIQKTIKMVDSLAVRYVTAKRKILCFNSPQKDTDILPSCAFDIILQNSLFVTASDQFCLYILSIIIFAPSLIKISLKCLPLGITSHYRISSHFCLFLLYMISTFHCTLCQRYLL